jgi:hypothetical protein
MTIFFDTSPSESLFVVSIKNECKRQKCLLYDKFESVEQTTFASQTSKCVGIDICVVIDKVCRNRHPYAKCVEFPTSLCCKRHLRRKRQSVSESTFVSLSTKCVAIDKCRVNKRRMCRNRNLCPNRRLCRNPYLYIVLYHYIARTPIF